MSLLELEYVKAFYGASQALFDVSMTVEAKVSVYRLGRTLRRFRRGADRVVIQAQEAGVSGPEVSK